MDSDRYARYGAMTGVIAVILFIAGFLIFGADMPGTDATADEWAEFFTDNRDSVQIGVTVASVGLFFLVWFLGSLRSAIATAEGGAGRLASIAFGGGLAGATIFLVAFSATAAAALRPDELDPTVTRALNDFALLTGGPAAAAITALFGATAIAGYRHGALPAPVAGFSALAAICQPLAFGVVFTDSGVFAADGVLGLYLPFVTAIIAIVTASVALARRAAPAPA
jgi:hypothetical protein